jgi:hypothetical protein
MRQAGIALWFVSYLVAIGLSWARAVRGSNVPGGAILMLGAGIPLAWGVAIGLFTRPGPHFWRDLRRLLGAAAVGYFIVANAALIVAMPPVPECETAPDPAQCEIGFGAGPVAIPATLLMGAAGLAGAGVRAGIRRRARQS